MKKRYVREREGSKKQRRGVGVGAYRPEWSGVEWRAAAGVQFK